MAEVFSPQVITREVDVSSVAPSISTSIAAIVGGAIKGPLDVPTFVSTPNEFVQLFGEPTPESYLGYTAINFLRQGNQLWVTRVASIQGDDPIATATTDTSAEIVSNPITSFGFQEQLVLQFDFTKKATIQFTPASSSSLSSIVATINAALSSFEPKLGTATAEAGSTIKIVSESKNGPLSKIQFYSTDTPGGVMAGAFQFKVGVGERTVLTEAGKSPATKQSEFISGGTLNTLVTFASISGNELTTDSLVNVSSQPQEAYALLTVQNTNLTAATYNTATITVTNNANVGTETLTINSIAYTFGTHITVGGDSIETAQNIVDAINDVATLPSALASGIPNTNVRAKRNGNQIVLTQVDPTAAAPTVTSSYTSPLAFTIQTVAGGVEDLDTAIFTLDGGTAAASVEVFAIDASQYIPLTPVIEKGLYYFIPGADFDIGPTKEDIATSLGVAIASHGAYDTSGGTTYAFNAGSNGLNQITVTTAVDLKFSGEQLTVDIGTSPNTVGSAIVVSDGNNLGPGLYKLDHGFDERSYNFPTIIVDEGEDSEIIIDIDFDIDFSESVIIPDLHEATLDQIAAAINSYAGAAIAQKVIKGGGEALLVSTPTGGISGNIKVSSDTSETGDPFETAAAGAWADHSGGTSTAVPFSDTGTGDNLFTFLVDANYEVNVSLTSNAALLIDEAVAEINIAAAAVHPSLANVASSSGGYIILTSPTLGSFEVFGSALQVTNELNTTGGLIFSEDTEQIEGDGSVNESITIRATSPGSWANDVIQIAFQDENPIFAAPNTSRVDVIINGSIEETFREVTINPDADGTLGTSGEGVFIETAINGVSNYIVVDFDDDLLDLDTNTVVTSIKIVENTSVAGSRPPYKLNGGKDGFDGLSDDEAIGVASNSAGNPTGLQVYRNPEVIFINLLAAPGYSSQAVQNELIAISEERGDTLSVIDPPFGLNPTEVVDWHNGQGDLGRTSALNTSYAATYGTWVKQFDPYNNIELYLPPSAFMLAQFAFNDKVSQPWFATAGLNRGKITTALDVFDSPTLGQRELMYGNGNAVNPIVNFVQDGIVIWGQKTLLRQESALNRINVRRMMNYAKTVIGLAARVILFEPNDALSVSRLIAIIEPVLQDIKQKRGLTEFKVVDATTARDRNLNRIRINVFLRPTRTIEVIEIPFIVTAEGQAFAV